MPSIIEGYNYDIFISYRQKDNKGDKWVSEFVEALKTEIESTFKEEISVYFDINPHDGLLETHDVDESLKEKLKCLVFIPIISRTYCDPKSFAWEHEFKAFVELASKDKFGLKVRLPNGNVASRVLPVRIHDLDITDIKECESVLGGVLRGIEFIYKEPGFNRPLKPDDDEKINLNKAKYRNQITKVALAIKEIVLGMKKEPSQVVKEKDQTKESSKEVKEDTKIDLVPHTKAGKWKLLSAVIIVAILIIASVFAYPKIFNQDRLEKLRSSGERISVAVMPFQIMTTDETRDYWQEMIQDILITYLSNYKNELEIRQRESINGLLQDKGLTNYGSITPSIASAISQLLDADIFIHGSIMQEGSAIRINAKLVDSKTKEVLKPFEIDRPFEEDAVLPIIDSLKKMVTDFLIINLMKKENVINPRNIELTNSPEAYRYFIYGLKATQKRDFPAATKWYQEALKRDTAFTGAAIWLSGSYGNQGQYDQAKELCLKVYSKRDQLPPLLKTWVDWLYSDYFETPNEEIKYLNQILEFDDQQPITYYVLGYTYTELDQFDRAIPEFEKSLEIYKKWGSKPFWINDYRFLGLSYHKTGQFKKEKKLYKKAEIDFPENPLLIYRQAILALSESNAKDAYEYIEKYKSIRKENSASELAIATSLASIYNEEGILDKAEEYYREANALDPKGSWSQNNLAYFLIDKDRNVNEGLEIIDKVLELNPDDFNYLHTKGWGLYKQGKFKEALEFLQKADSLKPIYDHVLYLHLEAAKKAVASLKNN
jgi:tetratricopeptide (TPR) repeat protein